MTTYRGETRVPKMATRAQVKVIQEILEINQSLAAVLQKRDELFAKLEKEQGCPLVAKVRVIDDEGKNHSEYRTFIVDTPKGHYVFYKSVDFTMNAKTSKEDRAVLGLTTRVVRDREVQEVRRGGSKRNKENSDATRPS